MYAPSALVLQPDEGLCVNEMGAGMQLKTFASLLDSYLGNRCIINAGRRGRVTRLIKVLALDNPGEARSLVKSVGFSTLKSQGTICHKRNGVLLVKVKLDLISPKCSGATLPKT